MKLDTLCLLLIGYILHPIAANQDKKDARPQPSHQLEQKSPNLDDHHGQGGQIIFHTPEEGYSHQHHFVYNPDKKQKYKHKKASINDEKKHKKKYGNDDDFEEVLQNYDAAPAEGKSDDPDGFKQSYHTEHYEVKKINPNARYPGEKYIIQGAYKVQETDPWGKPTTSFHEYDSPIGKIAASILSKYDYTNFRPGESDDYNKNEEFENDDGYGYDDNKKKKSKIGFDDDDNHHHHHDYSVDGDKKNYETPKSDRKGYDYNAAVGYIDYLNAKSEHQLPFNSYTAPIHEEAEAEHKHEDETEDYSVPEKKEKEALVVGNLKERPADIEYIVPHKTVSYDDGAADHAREAVEREMEYEFEKEFGHLIHPGHTVDPGYKYDSEWEKRLIEHIYGQDHAASDKFVQKVKPLK